MVFPSVMILCNLYAPTMYACIIIAVVNRVCIQCTCTIIIVHVYVHTQGNISRQEAVSMIPPLLLDVKPHHKVSTMFVHVHTL